MKRSKLLVMVLALVLCISMVLVGCSKKDDVIEEVTLSEEEQKNEVVKTFNQNDSISLSELNARESLEKILGTNVFELTLNEGGYKSIVAYKDGYVYTDIKKDEWLYIGASDVATFEKNPLTNKWVGKIVGGNNDSMGIIGGGSVLSKVQVPEEIKLPELKASDLTVEDGKVVLSNDYIKAAIKQPDLYKALTGTETPTDDVKAAIDGVIDSVVDAFGLKVSFRFAGTKLGKVSVSVDLDASGLSDEIKAVLPETLKGSVDLSLNDKVDALTGVKVSLEVGMNDSTVKINGELKTIVDGDTVKGLDCTASVDIKNTNVAPMMVDIDIDTDESSDTPQPSYSVYGDESYSVKIMVDLSKIKAEKGAKVVDVELNSSVTAKKILDDEGKEATEETSGLTLKDFNKETKTTFVAEVTESGVISFSVKADGTMLISGTVNFNAAPSMPEVPAEITSFVKDKMK